jgi:isoleucyl-tRNA synthetase
MFRPVTSKVNFPEIEKKILKFWKEKRLFEKSVEQRKGGPLFTLYEGPPTVNASPGIHHVLARVFKDVFPRYKTMKGFYSPRKAGWDTHGLPVEVEIEGELNLGSKQGIESYGISEFNARCRQRVLNCIKEWEKLTNRTGFWIDTKQPYITLDNNYIETCWWIIKNLWDKELVYQGYRVTPHCPRCGTSLSSHEVALGYKDNTPDPSIYIKFEVDLSKGNSLKLLPSTHLLAWTTTPWTLPANVALAVSPEDEYALVEMNGERLILASALLGILEGDYQIVATFKGQDLVGLQYKPLYQTQTSKPAYRVVAGDFVSLTEGTGIVHIAPAYGAIDLDLSKVEDLPLVHTVDLRGKMFSHPQEVGSAEISFRPDYYRKVGIEGKFVKEADPLIVEDLKERGLIHRYETIRHTYPFCWRCGSPLLYYAKSSWYIKTTALKEKLLEGNEKINWYPEHIKHGRFGDWLENNVDWAFSRERYWGTPLPIWRCESCGNYECIGSVQELKERAARELPLQDLHRPYIDSVTFTCSHCGGKMKRVPEVVDCWFDSGAMPLAQWHYPFENATLLEDGRFPADFICEAVDQTRGWFYSLHALSTLTFEKPCFKNVICLGHVLDVKGEKMSKSKGNVVDPWAIFEKFGADALRWHLLTSSPPGNVRRFKAEAVGEVVRKFLLTLWNTYSFSVIYANIDKFDPRSVARERISSTLQDRWILSELNRLILEVDSFLENYDATNAGRRIEDFVERLSNWYVRRSRRRFWKSENDADKLAAYATLYECLVTLSKLLAPLTPFISEEIYQNLVRSPYPEAPESVHLTDFPVSNPSLIDDALNDDIRLAMKISSLGRAARSKANLKVRQPLERILVKVNSKKEKEGLERMASQILDELNVKEMAFVKGEGEILDFEVKPNLPLLGPKYGKRVGEITSALKSLDAKEVALKVREGKEIRDLINQTITLLPEEILVEEKANEGYSVASEGSCVVGVVTEISPELADEGLARELVHHIQTMRRSANFDIADYIVIYYQSGENVSRILKKFSSYIKGECLARDLVKSSSPDGVYTESLKIGGEEVVFGMLAGK